VAGGRLSKSDPEGRFNALLATHGPSLARLAGSYARDPTEREDLFQEIAIAVWRALPRFRGECSERTFLFRIAHNRGMSHLARRRLPMADLDEDVELPDVRPNPEQALSSEQQGRRLFEAVERLSVGYRQVVTLALEGMTYGEIAEVLGITESNVGARFTRAREMLRRLVQ
jgi:RNA polymerase sigma factor (sigma-70 family)